MSDEFDEGIVGENDLDEREVQARQEAIDNEITRRLLLLQEDDMRRTLATAHGRAVVWYVLSLAGVYRAPVTHPQETFREVGRQDVGRELIASVFAADGRKYHVMRQEAEDRARELRRSVEG